MLFRKQFSSIVMTIVLVSTIVGVSPSFCSNPEEHNHGEWGTTGKPPSVNTAPSSGLDYSSLLPKDVKVIILSYLPQNDIFQMMRMSRSSQNDWQVAANLLWPMRPLRLSNKKIGIQEYGKLFTGIFHHLNFDKVDFTDEEAAATLNSLNSTRANAIESVRIENSVINSKVLVRFINLPNIKRFEMFNCCEKSKIGTVISEDIFEKLPLSLLSLTLKNCIVEENEDTKYFSGLADNKNLRTLNIAFAEFESSIGKSFIEGLAKSSIRILNMSCCDYDNETWMAISSMLATTEKLSIFKVTPRSLDHLKLLATALEKNHSLEKLTLTYSDADKGFIDVTEGAIKFLIKSLKENTTLHCLEVSQDFHFANDELFKGEWKKDRPWLEVVRIKD